MTAWDALSGITAAFDAEVERRRVIGDKMKTLSLTQPWATLVAIGAKRIETRSWRTNYRGRIAIHAAKGFPKWARDVCLTQPFDPVLRAAGFWRRAMPGEEWKDILPLGAVIATCDLVRIVPTRALTSRELRWDSPIERRYSYELTEDEEAFGDYSEGRYAWLLDNVESLAEPIPARGALGLWEWQP